MCAVKGIISKKSWYRAGSTETRKSKTLDEITIHVIYRNAEQTVENAPVAVVGNSAAENAVADNVEDDLMPW